MKINVKINQEDAIKAGSNQFGILEVEVDISKLSPAQREMLAEEINNRDKVLYGCRVASEDAIINFLQAEVELAILRTTEDARRLAEEINRVLAMSDEKFDKENTSWWWDHSKVEEDPRVQQRLMERTEREAARRQSIISGLLAINDAREFLTASNKYFYRYPSTTWIETPEIINKRAIALLWCEARNQEERLKSEAEAAAARERKENQLSAWVLQHGTDNQKARQALGLLPEDEVINCIRDQVFLLLTRDGFERYERMTAADVCECEYGACDVEFEVDDATELTADQYTSYERIKCSAPEAANIQARVHKGKSERCEVTLIRCSVLVTVVVGELTLSREYTLPNPE